MLHAGPKVTETYHACSVWLVEVPKQGPASGVQYLLKLGGHGDHSEEALTVFPSHPALQRVTHAAPELLQQVCVISLPRCLSGWPQC